jgi:chromosome partitioning protein
MHTIAVVTFKGGSGKTTTSGYLAAYLAQELQARDGRERRTILAVDLDHQAHLTRWMLSRETFDDLQVDLLPALTQRDVRLADVIVRSDWPGIDLAPSSSNLGAADLVMAGMTKREERLRQALAGVADTYRFAVLDCPPTSGLITLNAVAAADYILAPVEAGNFSLAGLSDFVSWVETMRDDGVHQARWLALVPTRYDRTVAISREMIEVLNEVSGHLPGAEVLEPIPRRIGQERMVAARRVAAGNEVPDVAQAYRHMARRVLQRLEPVALMEDAHAQGA